MREIDTRVTTYDPELAWVTPGVRDDPVACMFPAEDGTGDWVGIAEHESVVRKLKDRITYLENVCDEQTRMLTGD